MYKRLPIFFTLLVSSVLLQITPAAAETTGKATASPAGYFELQNDPWLNLHHFLYHLARYRASDMKLRSRVPISQTDLAADLGDHADTLDEAVRLYEPYLDRDLLFDEDLSAIRVALLSGSPESVPDPAIRQALYLAMPVYQDHYWEGHQRTNEAAIAALVTLLKKHETEMADRLAVEIDSRWPEEPIRADFTPYAHGLGAYTANAPNNVVLSSSDPDTLRYSFEILFHESAHTEPLGTKLYTFSNKVIAETGAGDRRFWHSVLFYATGRVAGEILDTEDYVPYAVATGIWTRSSVAGYYEALEAGWAQGDTFEERVRASVAALVAQKAEQ